MKHPDKLTLQRFLDGDFGVFGRMKLKHHISNCPECQQSILLEQEERKQQNEFISGIAMLEEAENEAEKHSCLKREKTR